MGEEGTTQGEPVAEMPDWLNPGIIPDGFVSRARALADDLERFEAESGYHELMERAYELVQEYDRWTPSFDNAQLTIGPAVGMDRVEDVRLRIHASAEAGCEGSLGLLDRRATRTEIELLVIPDWIRQRRLANLAERASRTLVETLRELYDVDSDDPITFDQIAKASSDEGHGESVGAYLTAVESLGADGLVEIVERNDAGVPCKLDITAKAVQEWGLQ